MTQEVKIMGGIGIVSVLLLVGSVFFFSGQEKEAAPQQADTAVLANNNVHSVVSDTAKVTIVEFADFQCPACARTQPIIKQILHDYKDEVTFVFRHFPLPQHTNAIPAARAAEAAGEQKKFFEMADLLYANQDRWGESRDPQGIFLDLAGDLGLNKEQFMKDLESQKYDDRIQEDKSDGMTLGANSTPTIFINGQKLQEAPTYDNLKEAIISQL